MTPVDKKNSDTSARPQTATEDILGYPISLTGVDESVAAVFSWLEKAERRCRYFVCANPHSLEQARIDSQFHQAIIDSDLIVPDGVGISIASKILGGRIRGRVTGSDMFYQLSASLNQKPGGASYYFLGSSEEILQKLKQLVARDYPNITVVGLYSPPYKPEFSAEDNRQMVEAINSVHPDCLWVGLTAPKQEKWIHQHRQQLKVHMSGPIGAVFDWYAGKSQRPSVFYQTLGLEWLPRFLKEPRRLWQRNMVSNPRFILRILARRLFGTGSR